MTPGSRLPGVDARQGRHHHADEEAAGPAPRAQKTANRRIARGRVRIEHVNSRVKRCRIVHDTCRLRKAGIHDLLMEVCCALHNIRVRSTPWQPMV
jgi:DDE superfamily endonuclease